MHRRTKIVGTLGPASWSEPVLRSLIEAGLNVVRINFSHAEHDKSAENIALIRRLSQETGQRVAILQDLQGPRIRTGKVEGSVLLVAGQETTLTTREITATSANLIGVDYEGLAHDVHAGDVVLIEDGLMQLNVMAVDGDEIKCKVITGGPLGSHKGINVPGVTLGVPTITDKDKEDLRFGLEQGVDFVALSFVRRGQDLNDLRQLMYEYTGLTDHAQLPMVIAKIEKHEAITNFDEILHASDGIMVARGDLGVEMPTEQLPVLQKMIIRKCNQVGKPVITATQMLDSMIRNPRPTRAEASDVANAILDGTDAVMLSGESANGLYPLQAVQVMAHIAETIENEVLCKDPRYLVKLDTAESITDAISQAVTDISRELAAKGIVATTNSGSTARMISRNRPHIPIFVASDSDRTCRRMSLIWGAEAFLISPYETTTDAFNQVLAQLTEQGRVSKGDMLIVTGGVPVNVVGQTNMLRIEIVKE